MDENNSADRFIEAYKKSIKLVPVTINNKQINLPITYSAAAANKYRKAYQETKDYRKAFCGMLFEIISSNWNFIYKDREGLDFSFDDLVKVSDTDLCKIFEAIVADVYYFKEFETQLGSELSTCFEKFHHLNRMEYEKYVTKPSISEIKLSGIEKAFNYNMQGIYKSIMPIADHLSKFSNTFQNIGPQFELNRKIFDFGNTGIYASLNRFNAIEKAGLFAAVQNSLSKHMDIIGMQTKSRLSAMEFVNPSIQNLTAKISSFNEIYKPSSIEIVRSALEFDRGIWKAVNEQQKLLEASLKNITRFEYNNKFIDFSSIGKDIALNIRPFLFDINIINLERPNLNSFLKRRSETLFRFGWWFIGSLSMSVVNYIYENQDSLTPDEVDEIICNYFEENNFEELNQTIAKWNTIAYYQKREKIFSAAVEQHKVGNYVLSIPALTPHPEGIIREFMWDTYQYIHRRFTSILSQFEEKAKEIDIYVTAYAMTCINSIYSNFEPTKPDEAPDFNRHKISHGLSINYDSRASSLKLILYLNEIFEIICGLKGIEL